MRSPFVRIKKKPDSDEQDYANIPPFWWVLRSPKGHAENMHMAKMMFADDGFTAKGNQTHGHTMAYEERAAVDSA